MSTISAKRIVDVIPGVVKAGGTALDLLGVMVTDNDRMPAGVVKTFGGPTADPVGAYFGAGSLEYSLAQVYFGGYDNCTKLPAALHVVRYPQTSLKAWIRGGKVSHLAISQLQSFSGSLTVTMDGYPRTASVSLASATSFTAAGALLQAALNAVEPDEASVTGSIAPASVSFTASIAAELMTVTAVSSGTIVVGAMVTGANVVSGTQIAAQISGTPGGVGVYAVSTRQTVLSRAMTATYGVLSVTDLDTGTVSPGQTIREAAAGTIVTAYGTGEGLDGTYYVNLSQTVASRTLTLAATELDVSFDSIAGGFVITSGVDGAESSVAYATGDLANALGLSEAAGATLSQGVDAMTPAAFMDWVKRQTQNWASFFTAFDPDGGSGNEQKMAFARWNNAQKQRFVYIATDGDVAPTISDNAPTSLGRKIDGESLAGTAVVYSAADPKFAAFMSGAIASIDFTRLNGRVTLAFRSQPGLIPEVTDDQTAANLEANGYNYYGAFGTANDNFIMAYRGEVTGDFMWLDTYINQIWMNNQFQLDLMMLLKSVGSIPYNDQGYSKIEASLLGTIDQAKRFGAIREGITLSSSQKLVVNTAAGVQIDDVLTARGWYLSIQKATPQVRQARGTPPCIFFYSDGGSIQKIDLASQALL